MAQNPAGDVQVPLSSGWTWNVSLLQVAELPAGWCFYVSRDILDGLHSCSPGSLYMRALLSSQDKEAFKGCALGHRTTSIVLGEGASKALAHNSPITTVASQYQRPLRGR